MYFGLEGREQRDDSEIDLDLIRSAIVIEHNGFNLP
jgi:hypothetical protein